MESLCCMKMVYLTVEQRTFLVSRFLELRDFDRVRNEFQQRFPHRPPPHRKTIEWNVRKFEREGTVKNLHKDRSGRRRTGRSDANVGAVTQLVANNARVSCRNNTLGIPSATFNRIMRLDLRWHPYKIFIRHELKNGDRARRLQFCRRFCNNFHNPRFVHNVVIGDECSFGMNGSVSTQNVRMYAPKGQPPDFYFEKNSDRRKVNVWAAVCGNHSVIGPYFFDGNVNGREYLNMLNNFALPNLAQSYNIYDIQQAAHHRLWWFQDGATPHRTIPVRRRIRQVFGARVAALGHDQEWPARSPDLTPCDYFLWGYIKQKVYKTPPATIADLRRRIVSAFDELRQHPEMIRNVIQEMNTRAEKCIQLNGDHVEGH